MTAVEQWRIDASIEAGSDAGYPPNLDELLQMQDSSERLLNPYHDSRLPIYNIDAGGDAKLFMRYKTIESAINSRWGSIWYNPDNGRVAFRIPDQGSSQATIEPVQ